MKLHSMIGKRFSISNVKKFLNFHAYLLVWKHPKRAKNRKKSIFFPFSKIYSSKSNQDIKKIFCHSVFHQTSYIHANFQTPGYNAVWVTGLWIWKKRKKCYFWLFLDAILTMWEKWQNFDFFARIISRWWAINGENFKVGSDWEHLEKNFFLSL